MGKFDKLFETIVRQRQDTNILFADLQYFVNHLGFSEKNIRGDHFTYKISGIAEK